MKKNRKASASKTQSRQPSAFGEYANRVSVQFGIDDATIEFTRTYPNGNDWPSEHVTRVTIPLTAAKLLVFGLMSNVAMMEGVNGPLRVSPGLVPQVPASQMLTPEVAARLAVLHVELFPAHPQTPQNRPESVDPGSITKH